MFIYFEREKEHVNVCTGEEEREERTLSRLCAVSEEPSSGLDLTNHEIRT